MPHTLCYNKMPKKVKDIGEFGLIERIAKNVRVDSSVIKGIGDDAAVIAYTKEKYLLVTIDSLIEDVHFEIKKATPFQIGWKALACNISDIAAMGGIPTYAVVSLSLPPCLSVGFVDCLYRGIEAVAHTFKVNIVGGDTDRSKKVAITICLLGEVERRNLTTRGGAKVGDIIFVTGQLGGARYGRHLRFIPRVEEARFLVRKYSLSAMIDISDGLASDLNQITRSSSVGAVIYEALIPVSRRALLRDALFYGEDFELLFTLPVREARRFSAFNKKPIITPFTQIGEIMDRRFGVKIVDRRGRIKPLKPNGFRHF